MATLDEVYEDRNRLALLAWTLADELGYPTYIIDDPAEPDWPVLAIDLPTGQISYHVPRALLQGREEGKPRGTWDGHDNAEKARRIMAFVFDPMPEGVEEEQP